MLDSNLRTPSSERNLRKLLSNFVGSNAFNVFSFPFDVSYSYRLAADLLKGVPSVKEYTIVPLRAVLSLIPHFNFTQVLSNDSFKKDGYKGVFRGYINIDKGVFLSICIGDDDSYDIPGLLGLGREGPENDGLANIYLFYISETLWLDNLISKLEKAALSDYKGNLKKNRINFLCFDHYYRLKNIKMSRKIDNNLELNYGPEFLKIYETLVEFLDSDGTGLALIFGEPGVGKTYFLRYLLGVLNKKVIYIPPHLVKNVSEPDFLGFLLNYNDFILIIEDAEEIVTNRQDSHNTSAVSNLLNLSDGILGDCIKARIIATFNQDIKNIDQALVRKGRLRWQYEFRKLEPVYANKLLKHLGINFKTNEPMSLGDIYNFNENNFRKEQEKGPVGFGKV